MNTLIKEKIRRSVVQEVSIKQLAASSGKNLVINCPIMINGNDAIERACAEDGNVKAAMTYILSVLPEPKNKWLRLLALACAADIEGNLRKAAKYLGFHETSQAAWSYKDQIKAIQDGKISFGEQDPMPPRDEMVQQDG